MKQQPIFDKQKQYDTLAANLLDGEEIIALYDASFGASEKGVIGLTNKRVILQRKTHTDESEKRIALTSIPYSSVSSISGGKEDFEVTFLAAGADSANHAHNVMLWGTLNEPRRDGGALRECQCSE